jgi:hypothetical protein
MPPLENRSHTLEDGPIRAALKTRITRARLAAANETS